MKLTLVWLLVLSLIAGVFSLGCSIGSDVDQMVLDGLKDAGSDLSKPHDVQFFLYFPTEVAAREAAKSVKLEVDSVEVSFGGDKDSWLCFARKRMVPEHQTLVELRKRFDEIAGKGNGFYEGWGADVVK